MAGGLAAVAQVVALFILVNLLWKAFVTRRDKVFSLMTVLWALAFAALAVKIVLQALSVVPSLGAFAFSFRPVIIAYLHLVLLCFTTFFLFGFFSAEKLLDFRGRVKRAGLGAFMTGVIANECILLLQSLLAIAHIAWLGAPYYLLGAAGCMFAGLVPLAIGRRE